MDFTPHFLLSVLQIIWIDLLLSGDLGCLLNMAGKLKRQGSGIQVRHIAEVLAGQLDEPAIGEDAKGGR